MFASPGYVRRHDQQAAGTTGFDVGRSPTRIALDWGGKSRPEDLMKGARAPSPLDMSSADAQRVAAAGALHYGGYMIDWLASRARAGRFRALRSRTRVCNTDVHGVRCDRRTVVPGAGFSVVCPGPPPELTSSSPHTYAATNLENTKQRRRFVAAGEQDYRVPRTQSLEFFHGAATTGCAFKTGGLSR